MVNLKPKQNMIVHSDHSILAEIWNVLWKHEAIRSVDADSFSVSVENGIVHLTGHLSKAYNRKLIENIAYSVPGVVTVHNKLVVDYDLTLQVAQILGTDERTRSLILPVGCSHGWVRLGGEVPTRELQLVVEEAVGQVPSVRGIVSLPRVAGESDCPERHALQPQINSRVHGRDGHVGIATSVVIQPRNRLVTHVVVDVIEGGDSGLVSKGYVVPVEAIEWVNPESIFLQRDRSTLSTFPAFDPAYYPPAPSDWQPPYPYAPGTVCWLCEEPEEPIRFQPFISYAKRISELS